MEKDPKRDADSGNDSTNEMLENENLIDPGNEHNHLRGDAEHSAHEDAERAEKRDADAGGDGTGSVGSKPD